MRFRRPRENSLQPGHTESRGVLSAAGSFVHRVFVAGSALAKAARPRRFEILTEFVVCSKSVSCHALVLESHVPEQLAVLSISARGFLVDTIRCTIRLRKNCVERSYPTTI